MQTATMRKTTEKHRSDRHNEQKDTNARSKEVRGQFGKNREESRSTKVNKDAKQEDRPSRSRDRQAANTGRTRSKSAKRDRNDSSGHVRDPPPRSSKAETRKSTMNAVSTDKRDASHKQSKSNEREDAVSRPKKLKNSKSTTTTPQAQPDKVQSSQEVSSKHQTQKSKTPVKQLTSQQATGAKQSESKPVTKSSHPEKNKTTSTPKQVEEVRSKKSHGSDGKRSDTDKSEKSNPISSQKNVDESRSKKSHDTNAKSPKKSGRQAEKSKKMTSPKHSKSSQLRKSQETHETTSKLPPTRDKESSAAGPKPDENSAKRSHASKGKDQMTDDAKSSRSKKSQRSQGLSLAQKSRESVDISRSPSKKSQMRKSEMKTPTSPSAPGEIGNTADSTRSKKAPDTHTCASSGRNSQDRGSRINTVTYYTEKSSTKSSQRNGTKYESHYTDDTPEDMLKIRAEITRRQKEYLRSLLRPRIAFIKDSAANAVGAIVGMKDNTSKAVGEMINQATACHDSISTKMDGEYWKPLKNSEYNIFNISANTKSTKEENNPDANDELNDTSRALGTEEGEAIDNIAPNGLDVGSVEPTDGLMISFFNNGVVDTCAKACGEDSVCCRNWDSNRSAFDTSGASVLIIGPLPPPDETGLKGINSQTAKLEGKSAAQVSDESPKDGAPKASPSEVQMEGDTLSCTESDGSNNADSSSLDDDESIVSDMTPGSTKSKNDSTMNNFARSETSGIDKEKEILQKKAGRKFPGNASTDGISVSDSVSQISSMDSNDSDDYLLALVATVTDGMEAMLPEEIQEKLENFHHISAQGGWFDTGSISESIATDRPDDYLLALVASVSNGMETMLHEHSGMNEQTINKEEHSRVYNFIVDGDEEEDAPFEVAGGHDPLTNIEENEEEQPALLTEDDIKLSLELSTTASKQFESVETEFVGSNSKVSDPVCEESECGFNLKFDSGKDVNSNTEDVTIVNLLPAPQSSAEVAVEVEPNADSSLKEDSMGNDDSIHSSTASSPRFMWSLNKIANIVRKRKTPNGSVENSSEDPNTLMKLLSKDSSNCAVVTSQTRDSVADKSLSASLPGISGFASADTVPWSNIHVAKDRTVVDNSTDRVVLAQSKGDKSTGVDTIVQETTMLTENTVTATITAAKEQMTDPSTATDPNTALRVPGMEARVRLSNDEGNKDAVPITSGEEVDDPVSNDEAKKDGAITAHNEEKNAAISVATETHPVTATNEVEKDIVILKKEVEFNGEKNNMELPDDGFNRDGCFVEQSQSKSEMRDEAIEYSLEDWSPEASSKDDTPKEREATSVRRDGDEETLEENEVDSTDEDPIEHVAAKDRAAKIYNSRKKSKKFRKNVMRWRTRNRENFSKLPPIAE